MPFAGKASNASKSKHRQKQPLWWRLVSLLLWIPALVPWALVAVFHYQPPALAAVTIVPDWCWLLLGAQLTGPMLVAWRNWSFRAAVAGWLVFAGLCVDETASLVREYAPPRHSGAGERLRIVSLNCKVGNPMVLKDLKRMEPDLVLLQESPQPFQLQAMAEALWPGEGEIVAGRDCSIIARRTLEMYQADPHKRFTQAAWTPLPGVRLHVFSLRLSPMPVEFRFWRERTRTKYTVMQQKHTDEIATIVDELGHIDRDELVIVGGDFNSPAGDRCEWALRSRLQEAFRIAGRGWGNTILNEFPFHRIDRIWLSPQLAPIQVRAVETLHSDHRMVVCDVYLPPNILPAQNAPAAAANANSAIQNVAGHGLGHSPNDDTRWDR